MRASSTTYTWVDQGKIGVVRLSPKFSLLGFCE